MEQKRHSWREAAYTDNHEIWDQVGKGCPNHWRYRWGGKFEKRFHALRVCRCQYECQTRLVRRIGSDGVGEQHPNTWRRKVTRA